MRRLDVDLYIGLGLRLIGTGLHQSQMVMIQTNCVVSSSVEHRSKGV